MNDKKIEINNNKTRLETLDQVIELLARSKPKDQTFCDTYSNAVWKVIQMRKNFIEDCESKNIELFD